nr:hypothetical protein [Orientia tsutsugamushi]
MTTEKEHRIKNILKPVSNNNPANSEAADSSVEITAHLNELKKKSPEALQCYAESKEHRIKKHPSMYLTIIQLTAKLQVLQLK